MPKRSNAFQRLIKQIYEQVATAECTVEESAMLPERSDGSEREADVLLSQVICGVPIQIAIECRDWRIKNDVTWVDSLIGKYTDLKIDKVVAVSATEFTPLASKKAEAHRIETLTLREALETDWGQAFTKLGMLQIQQSLHPVSASVETEPPLPGGFAETAPVYSEDGKLIGTFTELCMEIVEGNKPRLGKVTGEQLIDGKRTVADIPNTEGQIELTHKIDRPLFLEHEGSRYRLKAVTLRLISRFAHTFVPVEHKALGDLRISSSEMTDAETGTVFEITAIQDRSRPGQASMRVRPQESAKKRKPKKKS